jgi:SAM-dependent methyltransferase
MPYDEARPILDAFRHDLPADLKGRTPAAWQAAWPAWTSQRDARIRARLARGDEDSVVNFWMYGTTFTARPRVTGQVAKLRERAEAEELLLGRLDDLVLAMLAPGGNERVQFARDVIQRQGIDLATPAGRDRASVYLTELRNRMVAENARYTAAEESALRQRDRDATLRTYASMYRERGLSSDTSVPADFAVEQMLAALRSRGTLGANSVGRAAIVGPGLDFTDKAEGYDFYPPQTIQPFALMDSLIRHGLARSGALQLTTFDVSPRVNQHLVNARQRAGAGGPYVLQLPLGTDDPSHTWAGDLVAYWMRLGETIGVEVTAMAAPAAAGSVRVRAVQIPPAVVLAITPVDLNVIVDRLELGDDERFDVIVATNVLVYYDRFEQALALTNIAKMLRPGGVFLTNYLVSPDAPMERAPGLTLPVFWDRQRNGDTMFAYQRR